MLSKNQAAYDNMVQEYEEKIAWYNDRLLHLKAKAEQMRALLERVGKGEPNLFTGELCFYPEEVDFRQLITDLRAFLAAHPKQEQA
jgi:hypothetical protein